MRVHASDLSEMRQSGALVSRFNNQERGFKMNHTKLRKMVMASLAGSMIANAANAGSVAGNGGTTEVTRILNNGELIIQSSQLYTEVPVRQHYLQPNHRPIAEATQTNYQ